MSNRVRCSRPTTKPSSSSSGVTANSPPNQMPGFTCTLGVATADHIQIKTMLYKPAIVR
jgi:hypothetical protein